MSYYSPQTRPHRPSALPLALAGAAFVLTLWLVAERAGLFRPAPSPDPRPVVPRGELADYEKTIIDVFERNKPSVVHITTERLGRGYWGDYTRYPEGTGTGFLWDDTGTVVTNYHVVQSVVEDPSRSRRIVVALDESDHKAVFVNGAPGHDIAVLRLVDPPSKLRPVQLGSSNDLHVGQTVLAIGNPFGLDQTLTTGVVSALDRSLPTQNGILNGLIQTDAAINPGNSGGPLLDSAGRLIGMNTAIFSPSGASAGIGFAVPVDTINAVVPALLSGEDTQRALGIRASQAVRWRAENGYVLGLPVREVVHDSGAEVAGLRPFRVDDAGDIVQYGDLILEVSGVPVRTVNDIQRNLKGRLPGEKVPVKVLRTEAGQAKTVNLMVEVR